MKESKLKVGNSAVSKYQTDWPIDTITEQIWNELNGAVTRSTINKVLTEVVPNYENARIQTFVPIFVRRDAVKRLRAMRVPIASPGINEADSSTESPINSDPSSSRNAYDEQDKTNDTGFIHWIPAT
jgi:hypothetical protein